MIGYVTLGTNCFDDSAAFYDDLLGSLGASRQMQDGTFVAWGRSPTEPWLSIIAPFDGKPATAGNGTMVAIMLDSATLVDEAHAKALALGGTDEGAPGPRGGGGFYAAYWRDLDGNKLCFFNLGA
ncbi:MAG: VOC family protein [Pseudomonadota bacterium]